MGTKIDPGKFDCYAKLDPDEPFFVLRAKDPIAPYLIQAWRFVRAGDQRGAEEAMLAASVAWQEHRVMGLREKLPLKSEKSQEASACAHDMFEWRGRYEVPK